MKEVPSFANWTVTEVNRRVWSCTTEKKKRSAWQWAVEDYFYNTDVIVIIVYYMKSGDRGLMKGCEIALNWLSTM